MSRIILFNKPYGVLSQFTPEHGHQGLRDFIPLPGFYAAGRLDADSEGLLILTDDGTLQHRLAHPRHKEPKTYWVQVEGVADEKALARLRQGVDLGDFTSLPAGAETMAEPDGLWPREPPIRVRKNIPTAWLKITLLEGKNRQVRRMTAKVGLPTLRLVRTRIGNWSLEGLAPGEWRMENVPEGNFAGQGTPRPGRARPDRVKGHPGQRSLQRKSR